MPEYTEVQKDYAKYRLERSKEDLDAAQLLFDNRNYRIANNRAYYCIFPAGISKMIGSAFTIRNASDYDDMFIASKADTEEQITNATYVYEELSKYINEILGK